MKKVLRWSLLAACALLVAGVAFAAEGKSKAADVQKYGARIKVKRTTDIAALAKDPALFAGKKIRIEGTVKEVCQGKGCWAEVEANGASFLARSLNESVLLPKDCKGWSIVVQGVMKQLPQAAKAEAKAAEADPAGHACPAPQWVLDTQGVELTQPATQ